MTEPTFVTRWREISEALREDAQGLPVEAAALNTAAQALDAAIASALAAWEQQMRELYG